MVALFACGGALESHEMRRVDHYEREQVVMPNGKVMCRYTPVFETSD